MWLPPIVTVFFGFRAWTSKVSGTFLTCSSMKPRSKRTRLSSAFRPAFAKVSSARGCRKSMPISWRICIACSWIWATCSSESMSYGFSVLIHMLSGAGVRQLFGDLAVAACLKGSGVDPLVVPGVHIPRVADGLGVGLRLLGQQRDFLFGKAELI